MLEEETEKIRIKKKKVPAPGSPNLVFYMKTRFCVLFFFDPNFEACPGPEKDAPLGLAGWIADWVAGLEKK